MERVELGDDECGVLHVRPVVVGQDADVAELAEERAAARYLEDGAVVATDRPREQGALHGQRAAEREARRDLEEPRQRSPVAEVGDETRDDLLAVAHDDVVEHAERVDPARRLEGPADRPPDHAARLGEDGRECGARRDDRLVVLVDPGEEKEVRCAGRRDGLDPEVEELHLQVGKRRQMGGERVRPDRHELDAEHLGVGEGPILGVDEDDPERRHHEERGAASSRRRAGARASEA